MRRVSNAAALLLAAPFIAFAALSTAAAQARPTVTMARPAAVAPHAPSDVQAFTTTNVCGAHKEVPDCTRALQQGLMLFTWGCPGCDVNWSAVFVVNGQPQATGDIALSKSKLSALTVRANQFKSTDCVAIRIFNPANAAQEATSGALCLSHVLASQATAPRSAMAPAAHVAGAPTPHPAPMPGGSPSGASASAGGAHGAAASHAASAPMINPNYVPAPTGLAATRDQKDCSSHGGLGGGLACQAALPAGQLALIWTCAGCKVDGYHLYRVDNGLHALLPPNGAYGHDATVTLALLQLPSNGAAVECFAVAAYKGALDSQLSNAYCGATGKTVSTLTLQPQHTLHWHHSRTSVTGVMGSSGHPSESYDATLLVGYADHYGEDNSGDVYSDEIHRSAVWYDLSALAGRTIVMAVLQFDALSSWHDYDNTVYGNTNLTALSPDACVVSVDKATDHWWQNNDLNSTVKYVSPGPFVGPAFNIDVTAAVKAWVGNNPPPNFGFVLRGGDENDLWHGNTNHVCLTQLNSVSLQVTYY